MSLPTRPFTRRAERMKPIKKYPLDPALPGMQEVPFLVSLVFNEDIRDLKVNGIWPCQPYKLDYLEEPYRTALIGHSTTLTCKHGVGVSLPTVEARLMNDWIVASQDHDVLDFVNPECSRKTYLFVKKWVQDMGMEYPERIKLMDRLTKELTRAYNDVNTLRMIDLLTHKALDGPLAIGFTFDEHGEQIVVSKWITKVRFTWDSVTDEEIALSNLYRQGTIRRREFKRVPEWIQGALRQLDTLKMLQKSPHTISRFINESQVQEYIDSLTKTSGKEAKNVETEVEREVGTERADTLKFPTVNTLAAVA